MVLKRREPKKAGQKPLMTKPLTILEVMQKRNPLMKKVNTPSVNIFIGNVINIINGRKNALMMPIEEGCHNSGNWTDYLNSPYNVSNNKNCQRIYQPFYQNTSHVSPLLSSWKNSLCVLRPQALSSRLLTGHPQQSTKWESRYFPLSQQSW